MAKSKKRKKPTKQTSPTEELMKRVSMTYDIPDQWEPSTANGSASEFISIFQNNDATRPVPKVPTASQKIDVVSPSQLEQKMIRSAQKDAAVTQAWNDSIYTKDSKKFKDLAKQIRSLTIQYSSALISQRWALPREAIEQMDRIDIRSLFSELSDNICMSGDIPLRDSPDFLAYCDREPQFMRLIPCFQEGALQCNKDRFIHWKIMDLNLEEPYIDIYLADYMVTDGFWTPGCFGAVRFQKNKDCGEVELGYDHNSMYDFTRLYTLINRSKLGWSKDTMKLWEGWVVKHAEITAAELLKSGYNNLTCIGCLFEIYMEIINYCLSIHKPSRPQAISGGSAAKAKTVAVPNMPQPERKVRMVGTIPVISSTVPRRPTEKTIIKYQLESWNTRGHMRHLKSGKVVYVKPSVHHRKALRDTATGNTPQSVIVIRNTDAALPAETAPDDSEGAFPC